MFLGVLRRLTEGVQSMFNDVGEAFITIQDAIRADKEYAWAWHCNIAMAAYDEGVPHDDANKIANRFMQMAFGVDTKEP